MKAGSHILPWFSYLLPMVGSQSPQGPLGQVHSEFARSHYVSTQKFCAWVIWQAVVGLSQRGALPWWGRPVRCCFGALEPREAVTCCFLIQTTHSHPALLALWKEGSGPPVSSCRRTFLVPLFCQRSPGNRRWESSCVHTKRGFGCGVAGPKAAWRCGC